MADEKPRILVVDDNSDTLLYLYDLLSSEGFHVEGSSSAVDALDHIRRRAPGVVIANVRMPEMNGVELLERIKRVSTKTRVILLGTLGDEAIRLKALEKGGEEFLYKPISSENLLRALGRVLEGTAH
jgi:FixJ family two-component response regulator